MKAAIVVLAILLVAFAVAAGGRAPAAKVMPEDSPRLIKWFGAHIKPRFDFRDVNRGCFDTQTTTFQIAPACVVGIKASSTKFRQLTLQVRQGPGATIDFKPAPNDDSGLSFDRRTLTNGGSPETLILPASGGSLTIICFPPAAACSIHAE